MTIESQNGRPPPKGLLGNQGSANFGAPLQRKALAAAVLALAACLSVPSAQAGKLEEVQGRGQLQCGVTHGVPGFSAPNDHNVWTGLEVDFCRALAAAIFDDADKVRYVPLANQERFVALSSGEVDVLSRTTTWNMSRDAGLGVTFVGPLYFDGQAFLVHKSTGVTSALDMSGVSLCIKGGTTTELVAADYFSSHGMVYSSVVFPDDDELINAYEDGRCDVFTNDSSALAALRSKFARPDEHLILPEIISKEFLGPVVKDNDERWFKINRWVYFALVQAEELGITQANVDEQLTSQNPEVRRLLGLEGELGPLLGLTDDWAYRVIKHVGNYGESFERNLGKGTSIGLARGLNALWTDGGLQYAPAVR